MINVPGPPVYMWTDEQRREAGIRPGTIRPVAPQRPVVSNGTVPVSNVLGGIMIAAIVIAAIGAWLGVL